MRRHITLWLKSLRAKLFLGLLVTTVPLIVVLLVNNFYSVQVVRNQVVKSNSNMLRLYLDQIDRNLQDVDNYLIDMAMTNLDLLDFDTPIKQDESRYLKAKIRLFQTINNAAGNYKSIDLLFLYSEKNKDLVMTQEFGRDIAERNRVALMIERMLENRPDTSDLRTWKTWQSEGQYYVYHVVKTEGVYIGAWVNASKLMVPLQLIDLGQNGAALLATDTLEPMNFRQMIEQNGIRLAVGEKTDLISSTSSNYLVIGQPSHKGSFYLFALISEKTVLEQLPYLQRISSIISVGAAILMLLFIIYMRKVFLLPIYRIIKAMRKLGEGHWNSEIENYPTSTEFEIMNDTYNHMVSEIQHLKINVYEEKLNHQRVELKHLQMQINPHFFLNSLNIIYNLATVKNFSLIQEMSKCLVAHFRFMFRSNSYLVKLKDELVHTKNYLRIQQLRFPDIFSYRIEAQEEVLLLEIPPLTIQTMVENSIKHAMNMDQPIQIDIQVRIIEEEDTRWIAILVADSGPGFPEAVLQKLQEHVDLTSEEGEHIGIWNVRRRLHLLYADRASIEFYNALGRGATVRIRIPEATEPREEE
jgi:Predicted signal transduction protein with a C-terminal ATPase domain